MPKYYEVQEGDSFKLKAVIAVIENHTTFRNLTLQQLEGFKEVLGFLRSLPAKLDAAKELPTPLAKKGKA